VIWKFHLWENGFFATPPSPQKKDEGYILPRWDNQIYLYSVADQVPDIVIKHVESIEAHGIYISQAVQALCRVPPERITEIIPRIITWIANPQIAGFIVNASHDLLLTLMKGGQNDSAFEIFRALSAPVLRSEFKNIAPSTHGEGPVVILYEDILGNDYIPINAAEELIKIDPRKVVDILDQHLRTALKLEAQVLVKPEFKYSAGWRIAVEVTGQDNFNDAKNHLLVVLLHALVILVNKELESSREIIKRYLEDDHKIFYRLGLYMLQCNPTAYKVSVTNEILKKENLDDTEIHHEFFLLLQQGFPILSHSDQEKLITTILDGPPLDKIQQLEEWVQKERGVDPDEYIQRYSKQWIRDRLWMLQNYINGKAKITLESITREIGKPEHPSFLMWSSGGFSIQEVSPIPKQELALLPPGKLIGFLSSWKPDPNETFGPKETSYRALARDLAEIIHENLAKYSGHLEEIIKIQTEYASSLLESFQKSNQMAIYDWEICIDLCERMMVNQSNQTPTRISYEKDWVWFRMCIIRLIEKGLSKESHKIPDDYLPRIRDLLLLLIDDQDPDEDQDRPPEGWVGYRNPRDVALNHVRPSALGALIFYAWYRTNINKENTKQKEHSQSLLEVEVKEALTKKLDRNIDKSRAVHSIFGRYFSCLNWLDQDWLKSNINDIFPENKDDEESLWYFVAAWDSFVIDNKYNPGFRDLLYSKYIVAIDNLSKQFITSSYVANFLAIHLVLEYLLGNYDLRSTEDQNWLIIRFFNKVSPENRGAGANACWRIYVDNPNMIKEYWPRIRGLWEWRIKAASDANHNKDFDEEMKNFAQLLLDPPKTETIKTLWPLLEGILPHIVNDIYSNIGWNSAEKFLAQEVKRDPVRSIQFYRLMRERRKVPLPGYYEAEEARTIIETAAAHKDSKEEAMSLIDMLGRSGNDKFRDIYDRYAT